jgi:pantoate--beta-alanine ligase
MGLFERPVIAMPKIIKTIKEMQETSISLAARGERVVFVPTMGYLHDGHRALLRVARPMGSALVMSIFVNPAQFGPSEDLGSYPRDLDRDLRMAAEEGVDIVFTPEAAELYPEGFRTYVEVEGLSNTLCGASRPCHFKGVATIVLKLFNIVMPRTALFGRKDFQQLTIIERMVKDLDIPVEIVGVETVREPDGLAMSSRNSYLNADERKAAVCVPRAMEEARRLVAGGEARSAAVIEKVKKIIEKEPLAVIDYINVCRAEDLGDAPTIDDGSMLFLAVKVGKARLIDNTRLK